MIKKLLNPLILGGFFFVLLFGSVTHLMYGNIQTSKYHYICQNYYMYEYLPEWLLKNKRSINDYIEEPNGYTGVWSRWFRNGSRQSFSNLINGKKHGKTIFWHENGVKAFDSNWNHGIAIGNNLHWYPNGNKEYKFFLINGKFDGKQYEWYEDGSQCYINNWKDGKKEGLHASWYQNGNKKLSGNFENDKEVGNHQRWYESGAKEYLTIYINGDPESFEQWEEDGTKKE
ncbi:MAG: hypothetical protein COA79_26580 [Planctomycetota bacterium]|nr:MAG: hypothetical protein COA79_26580 [Planctomycetota bacterium]